MVPFTARSYLSAPGESRQLLKRSSDDRTPAGHEADERHDERHHEDDLCDARGAGCEAEEAEHGRDQCNEEEGNGPGKHWILSCGYAPRRCSVHARLMPNC